MGTEIWIISLPLSDSILCLKIIHPPNFREEPKKRFSYMENRFLIPCEKRNVSLKISESSLKTPFSNLETVFSAQPMSRRFIYLLTPGKLETN